MARLAAAVVLTATLAAGCSTADAPPMDAACIAGPQSVRVALRAAPGEVALEDQIRISTCVKRARSDADLQNVGVALTQAAEELELRALTDPRAALELGYLIGAARRGAGAATAVQAELIRRLERSGALEGISPQAERSLVEGLKAGETRG